MALVCVCTIEGQQLFFSLSRNNNNNYFYFFVISWVAVKNGLILSILEFYKCGQKIFHENSQILLFIFRIISNIN